MKRKKQYDFIDLMTFGLFLLALLTFVFTFCKLVHIEKPPSKLFGRVLGGNFYLHIRSNHLVDGCSSLV